MAFPSHIGRSAEDIATARSKDHSQWYLLQARSWLDLAGRTQNPALLHLAAFNLRYGLEYLLFELVVVRYPQLSAKEYEECIGSKDGLKRLLNSKAKNYAKLADFTRVVMSLQPEGPQLRFWNLADISRLWGVASEYLHFMGAQAVTYADPTWFVEKLARLDSAVAEVWENFADTEASGLFDPETAEPEVRQAWKDFVEGTLSQSDLRTHLNLALPILLRRRSLEDNLSS